MMARAHVCGMCGMVCGMVCGIETVTGQGLCGMCGINAHIHEHGATPCQPTTKHKRARKNMPHMPHMPLSPFGMGRTAVRHRVRHGAPTPHAAQPRSRALTSSLSRLVLKIGKGGLS